MFASEKDPRAKPVLQAGERRFRREDETIRFGRAGTVSPDWNRRVSRFSWRDGPLPGFQEYFLFYSDGVLIGIFLL